MSEGGSDPDGTSEEAKLEGGSCPAETAKDNHSIFKFLSNLGSSNDGTASDGSTLVNSITGDKGSHECSNERTSATMDTECTVMETDQSHTESVVDIKGDCDNVTMETGREGVSKEEVLGKSNCDNCDGPIVGPTASESATETNIVNQAKDNSDAGVSMEINLCEEGGSTADGTAIEISAGGNTADGTAFRNLVGGSVVDGTASGTSKNSGVMTDRMSGGQISDVTSVPDFKDEVDGGQGDQACCQGDDQTTTRSN